MIKKIVFFALISFIFGCASTPPKKTVSQSYITGQTTPLEKADKIKNALTLGINQLTAGYSAEVMLYTEPLIIAQETEKGRTNMDAEQKTRSEIKKLTANLVKNKTCFMFTIHTYTIDRAKFTNWVAKTKDSSGKLQEIEFNNISGVQSVPTTGNDMNGRPWHNASIGCTKTKIDISKPFSVYLIPQIKNNSGEDETTILTWEIN